MMTAFVLMVKGLPQRQHLRVNYLVVLNKDFFAGYVREHRNAELICLVHVRLDQCGPRPAFVFRYVPDERFGGDILASQKVTGVLFFIQSMVTAASWIARRTKGRPLGMGVLHGALEHLIYRVPDRHHARFLGHDAEKASAWLERRRI